MGFWCMDCSIGMTELERTGVDSIIFTSWVWRGCVSDRGTLSPMRPLISEFQIPIENVLENMHVISSSQVRVGVASDV